jgi:hypothetical protein
MGLARKDGLKQRYYLVGVLSLNIRKNEIQLFGITK